MIDGHEECRSEVDRKYREELAKARAQINDLLPELDAHIFVIGVLSAKIERLNKRLAFLLPNGLAAAYDAVVLHFVGDEAKADAWFRIPNPLLGNITPNDMIRTGREALLIRFIEATLAENFHG